MLKVVKKTIKHSVIYGLGKISGRIVGVVLLPLYTQKISISDYGAYAIIELFIQLNILIFSFGLNSAMFRWMNLNTDKKYRGSLIFTTLTVIVCISVIIFFIGFNLKQYISFYLLDDTTYQALFDYVFLIISIELIKTILFNMVRIYEKSFLFSVISIFSLIINLSLNIYLISYVGKGIEGILISSAVSGGFIVFILFLFFLKDMNYTLNLKPFIEMVKFGFPIIFSAIFGLIINLSDRYIIKLFLNLSEVGKYTFVYKIGTTVNVFLIQSFLLAWPAIAWENIKKQNPEEFISKMTTYFTFITTWFTLALSITSKPLIYFISSNPEYNEAYGLVPLIALSFVFTGLYHILGFPLHFKKKTKHFIQIVGISALLNLVFNLLFIPIFGITSAALSTVLSYFLMSLLSYFYTKRYFTLSLEIRKIIIVITTYILLNALNYLITTVFIENSILFSGILIILFPVILYYLNFFETNELETIKRLIKVN